MQIKLTINEARELFGQRNAVVQDPLSIGFRTFRNLNVERPTVEASRQANDAIERSGYKRGLAVAQTSVADALHRNQCAIQSAKRGTAAHRTLTAQRQSLLAVAAEIKRDLENA